MKQVLKDFYREMERVAEEFKNQEGLGMFVVGSTAEESFINLQNAELIMNSLINACVQDQKVLGLFCKVIDISLSVIEGEADKSEKEEEEESIMIPFPKNKLMN